MVFSVIFTLVFCIYAKPYGNAQEYKVIMHHQIYAMRIELSKKTLMTIGLDIRHVYTFHTVDSVLFFCLF